MEVSIKRDRDHFAERITVSKDTLSFVDLVVVNEKGKELDVLLPYEDAKLLAHIILKAADEAKVIGGMKWN